MPGFDKTLTPSLVAERDMAPALYVDIDCDLYSSSVTVLEWLFENKLIVPGTIIWYDDIAAGGGYSGGEGLVHRQAVRKYEVVAKEIRPACCFEIESYRGAPPSSQPPPPPLPPPSLVGSTRRLEQADAIAECRHTPGSPVQRDRCGAWATPGAAAGGVRRRV